MPLDDAEIVARPALNAAPRDVIQDILEGGAERLVYTVEFVPWALSDRTDE